MNAFIKAIFVASAVFALGTAVGQDSGGFPSRPKFQAVGVGQTAPVGTGNLTATGTITAAQFVGGGAGLTGIPGFPYSRTNFTSVATYQLSTTNNTGQPVAGMEIRGNSSHASLSLRDTSAATNQQNANMRYVSNLMRFGVCDDNYVGCAHFMQAEVSAQQEFDDLFLHVRSGAQIRLGDNGNPNDVKVTNSFHVHDSSGTNLFGVLTAGTPTFSLAMVIDQTGGANVNFSGNVRAANFVNTNRIQPFSGTGVKYYGNTQEIVDSSGGNTATVTLNGSPICTVATSCGLPAGITRVAAATINEGTNTIIHNYGVTSSTHPATGTVIVDLTAAGFSSAPSCTGSHSGAGSAGFIQVYSTSATSMEIDAQNTSVGASDTIVSFICVGN